MEPAVRHPPIDERLDAHLAVRGHYGAFDPAPVRRAFAHAVELYGDSMHWSNESLMDHCVGVLGATLSFVPDEASMAATLLHHALEEGRITHHALRRAHGEEVRSIVAGMHLLSHASLKRQRVPVDRLRMMFLKVAEDIRPVLLTLCGYRHVLSRIDTLSDEDKKMLCRDALHIYAPVAARLGIYTVKHALERQAFPVAYPVDSARIEEQLQALHATHGDFLEEVIAKLEVYLRSEGVRARIEVREKEPYSVFQKMQSKSLTHVQDVYDLFACRVIVDSEESCYKTLGLLHRMGHPVANRFKDYIAFPKPNGYRSLHTTLARLEGVPESIFVEVQIRTEEMHRDAQLGLAAHWRYKQHGPRTKRSSGNSRLQSLVQGVTDAEVGDHIFALTPRGDIIELPEGATPLDFAFYVHSAVGLSFRAARVNGAIVPLTYHLENGDIVEILRHKEPQPSEQWLQHLKTSGARSRLKRYLHSLDRGSYVQMGRDLMNRELSRHGLAPLDTDLSILKSLQHSTLTISEREDILMKVGQGAQSAASVLQHADAVHGSMIATRKPLSATLRRRGTVELEIPMPVRFARCCRPDEAVPEALAGVVGRDGYVRVHKATCNLLAQVNPDRRIAVRWADYDDQASN